MVLGPQRYLLLRQEAIDERYYRTWGNLLQSRVRLEKGVWPFPSNIEVGLDWYLAFAFLLHKGGLLAFLACPLFEARTASWLFYVSLCVSVCFNLAFWLAIGKQRVIDGRLAKANVIAQARAEARKDLLFCLSVCLYERYLEWDGDCIIFESWCCCARDV